MGWIWASTKDPSNVQSPSQTTTSPKPFDPPPAEANPPFSNDSSSTNADLRAFLESTQEPQPPSPLKPTTSSPHQPPPTTLITPTTTLPSTLSCRSAFDAAFYCQSFGGQFANIYRYGSLRGCSEQWGDFWFCVRTNRGLMDEGRREETVRAWAMNKERAKYGKNEEGDGLEKGSSEDVWEARRWKVRGTFEGDWGDLVQEGGVKAEVEMQVENEVP